MIKELEEKAFRMVSISNKDNTLNKHKELGVRLSDVKEYIEKMMNEVIVDSFNEGHDWATGQGQYKTPESGEIGEAIESFKQHLKDKLSK